MIQVVETPEYWILKIGGVTEIAERWQSGTDALFNQIDCHYIKWNIKGAAV